MMKKPTFFIWFLCAFILSSAQADRSRFWTIENLPTEEPWYYDAIQLERAWQVVDRTPDVKIGIIDVDFEVTNPDLTFDLENSIDYSGYNFTKLGPHSEFAQHGTLVSAIIGANGLNNYATSGISKQAHMLAFNMLSPDGKQLNIETVIRNAVDAGVKVINGSFGYHHPEPEILEQLRRGLVYAREKDVLLVFSAGNYGPRRNNDLEPFYPANFSTEFDNVISVGASNPQDGIFYASSFGRDTVDLLAPGNEILVPVGRGRFRKTDGTSEAAPIVAGVAALMRQIAPSLKAHEIKSIIMRTVDVRVALAHKCRSSGRLNAFRAVTAAKWAGQR